MQNEFRQDPLSGDWVLLAPTRAKKPNERERLSFPGSATCPFDDPQATGQETPIAIYSHGKKIDSPEGWTVQVLPNKFPAVLPGQCGPVIERGLFSVAAGVGSHELVITRDHDRHFANFSEEEMLEVINVYRERYAALSADPCNAYILIIHNHGVLAGASIFHNHSQILSMPIMPPRLSRMFERSDEYFKKNGKRLASAMLEDELKEGKRIVFENDKFVALCPYASRSPYEVRIFPRSLQPVFGMLSDQEAPALATVMREVFVRLDKAVGNPDYVFFIHTAGPQSKDSALDWHIDIMPRFSPAAGVEFGTGIFSNAVDPDEAAEKLRSVNV